MKCIETISVRRTELMGGAILMVLLYHCSLRPHMFFWFANFSYWYFGVDIFMLLSGFGLCNSWEKNSLQTFYKNRLKRVLPLYYVQVILRHLIDAKSLTLWGFIGEMTTLSFWGIGDGYTNWYVDAIVLFYLLFPILYKIATKFPIQLVFTAFLFASICLKLFNLDWRHECMVARFPIFVIGIVYYRIHKICNSISIEDSKISLLNKILLISLIFWNIAFSYNISAFLITAAICPFLVYCCPVLFELVGNSSLCRFLNYMGRHSYEFFIADFFVGLLVDNICHSMITHSYTVVLLYAIFTVSIGLLFIVIQQFLNKIINKI